MKETINKVKTPTGYVLSFPGERGTLETLSIGDYGKPYNVKADFLGYTREINGVPNVDIMPLSEKWVVTVSTQYGCPEKCTFCDVPNVDFRGNVSVEDFKQQLFRAIEMFPDVKYTERLNLHFARMGDGSYNHKNILEFSIWLFSEGKKYLRDVYGLSIETIHPVLTTMLPKRNPKVKQAIYDWVEFKNTTAMGQAGIQLSINTTDEIKRDEMFGQEMYTIEEIGEMVADLPKPLSRKYCLNFAYASGNEVDPQKLLKYFDPEKFMIKITPIHMSNACKKNDIKTIDGYSAYYPYKEIEEPLKAAGYDVLIFVPSQDEEDGLITCGNLALGGSEFRI